MNLSLLFLLEFFICGKITLSDAGTDELQPCPSCSGKSDCDRILNQKYNACNAAQLKCFKAMQRLHDGEEIVFQQKCYENENQCLTDAVGKQRFECNLDEYVDTKCRICSDSEDCKRKKPHHVCDVGKRCARIVKRKPGNATRTDGGEEGVLLHYESCHQNKAECLETFLGKFRCDFGNDAWCLFCRTRDECNRWRTCPEDFSCFKSVKRYSNGSGQVFSVDCYENIEKCLKTSAHKSIELSTESKSNSSNFNAPSVNYTCVTYVDSVDLTTVTTVLSTKVTTTVANTITSLPFSYKDIGVYSPVTENKKPYIFDPKKLLVEDSIGRVKTTENLKFSAINTGAPIETLNNADGSTTIATDFATALATATGNQTDTDTTDTLNTASTELETDPVYLQYLKPQKLLNSTKFQRAVPEKNFLDVLNGVEAVAPELFVFIAIISVQ